MLEEHHGGPDEEKRLRDKCKLEKLVNEGQRTDKGGEEGRKSRKRTDLDDVIESRKKKWEGKERKRKENL